MVGDGRDPHAARLPVPLRRGAIKAGATTINLPDTVGYATPSEYRDMFANVRARVPNADKAVFSVHCHNDLGLAIANSLAGIEGGARQVECTINGIGERAGNAALEEIVMALRTRADVLPYETGIESTMLTRASKLVSHATNFPVQFNKAIVGRNAFAHESGIHQDGMLKNAETYEIMTPGLGRADQDLPGDGQAFRPGGLPLQAGGSRPAPVRQPVPGRLRPLQGAWPTGRSTSTTRTSRRWSTRTSPRPTTGSGWSPCR